MDKQQLILIGRQSEIENPEKMAETLYHWLVEKDIIAPGIYKEEFDRKDRYLFSNGLVHILNEWGLDCRAQLTGLYFETQRTMFFPRQDGGVRVVVCPFCQQVIAGEPEALTGSCLDWPDIHLEEDFFIYNWIDKWISEHINLFACPLCAQEGDINQFYFIPQWGFSNFAVIFGNGLSGIFKQDFLDELTEKVGHEIVEIDYYG